MYGLWPGVIGFANDADYWCVECAIAHYGKKKIMAVINGTPGYEKYEDDDGNSFNPILGTEEFSGDMICHACGELLDPDGDSEEQEEEEEE